MIETKELFNNLVNNYGERYSLLQKRLFCEFIKNYLQNLEINCKIETYKKNNNIIIGDLSSANLVISAHYDTSNEYRYSFLCGVTNKTYKNIKFALSAYKSYVTAKKTGNKYNYNDNTSGICCVLQLTKLKHERVAFILFDNEENNLYGSRILYKKYKYDFEDKLLLNLDCVGCGDYVGLIYYTYFNNNYADKLLTHFKKSGNAFKIMPSNSYITDAKIFKKSINISCYHKHNNEYLYYDIHTKNDNKIEINNLIRVVNDLNSYINEMLPKEEKICQKQF
jgi:hypothetical protein